MFGNLINLFRRQKNKKIMKQLVVKKDLVCVLNDTWFIWLSFILLCQKFAVSIVEEHDIWDRAHISRLTQK